MGLKSSEQCPIPQRMTPREGPCGDGGGDWRDAATPRNTESARSWPGKRGLSPGPPDVPFRPSGLQTVRANVHPCVLTTPCVVPGCSSPRKPTQRPERKTSPGTAHPSSGPPFPARSLPQGLSPSGCVPTPVVLGLSQWEAFLGGREQPGYSPPLSQVAARAAALSPHGSPPSK